MTHEPVPDTSGARVPITLERSLFERIELLRGIIEVADLSQEEREATLKTVSPDAIVDAAVDGFLEGVAKQLGKIFPE